MTTIIRRGNFQYLVFKDMVSTLEENNLVEKTVVPHKRKRHKPYCLWQTTSEGIKFMKNVEDVMDKIGINWKAPTYE